MATHTATAPNTTPGASTGVTVMPGCTAPMTCPKPHAARKPNTACPRKERELRAHAALRSVSIDERLYDHRSNELSGGQMQRVAIARALVNDPALILADEPTGNLDTATGDMVLATFKRLRDAGKTIVLITHEPDVAAHADRVVHIRDGRLYEGPHLGAADGEGARP